MNQSAIYADWLQTNPDATLTVFAGETTFDEKHPSHVNGKTYYDRGLQEAVFGRIRGTTLAQRVLVCSYPSTEHAEMYKRFRSYLTQPPVVSSEQCPHPHDAKPIIWRP